MYDKIRRDLKWIHSQVRKAGNIFVFTVIKYDRDFINDGVLPILFDLRLYILALIRANIVFAQNLFDLAKSDFDGFLVVRGTVHTKQVFEDIGRYIRPLLHQSR